MTSNTSGLANSFQHHANPMLESFRGLKYEWSPDCDLDSSWLYIAGSDTNGFDVLVTVFGGVIDIKTLGVSTFVCENDPDKSSERATKLIEEMIIGKIILEKHSPDGYWEYYSVFRMPGGMGNLIRRVGQPATHNVSKHKTVYANNYLIEK